MALALLLSLISTGNALEVSLWTDRDNAVYFPGEALTVYFMASQACYVAVYNVEPGGGVTQLFPPSGDNGWVRASQTYQLPPSDADYDYRVSAPAGTETIICVASQERLPALHDEGPDIVTAFVDIEIKESEPAELIIVSQPRGCRIYLTETASGVREYVGDTPRAIVVRPGDYTVEIKRAGFRTIKRRVQLDPGEKHKVFVRL